MSEPISNLDWSPASTWSASFRTHQLDQSNRLKLEFKPTFGVRAFCMAFRIIGALPLLVSIPGWISGSAPIWAVLGSFAFGGMFLFFATAMERVASAPRVFDRITETYQAIEYSFVGANREVREAISAIAALQVLDKRVAHSEGSYTAYELNLVLNDGRRHSLVCHSNYTALKLDAEALASELGVPIVERQLDCR